MFDWIKSLLGTLIKDGELAKEMQRIPCIVNNDGQSFRPGTTVNFGLNIFVVKHVFITNDLMKCSLMVENVANETEKSAITEEIMLDLDEVIPMQNWQLSDALQTVAKDIATNSYSELFEDIPYYPLHIKKAVRKHMLISKLRRTIHYFLTGLEMVGNFNLGLIDWEHDPTLLKQTRLVYKIEDSHCDSDTNEFDDLLGPKWDMVDLSVTMDSFRIVLTMEIKINNNGELCLTGHAATCSLIPEPNYRQQYLKYSTELPTEMAAATQSRPVTRQEDGTASIAENKTSLLWDSFNAQKEPDMFSTPMIQGINLSEENSVILTPAAARVKEASNIGSICDLTENLNQTEKLKSESGNSSSRTHSRISQSTASTRHRLQGLFQTGPLLNNPNMRKTSDPVQQQCPFPTEWQFGSIPEVITNDEDVD